jgi:cobyrinic acid a,c-diamide synthase
MFLHEQLEDDKGSFWPMVGAIPGRSFRTPKLGRFGYIDITAKEDGLLAAAGDSLPAHEFHYWDSDAPGEAFRAQKPQSTRGWDCAHATSTLYAGYPHLCLHARPESAKRFVKACAAYGQRS